MNIKEATDKFLQDLAISKSKNTVSAYRTALNHLCACCGDRDAGIKADIVPEFVRWLHEHNPTSQNTLNLYLVALTRFYEWLVLSDLAEQDVLRFRNWVAQYRKQKRRRLPRVPDEGDVQKLLACIRVARPTPAQPHTEYGRNLKLRWLRDLALIETLRSTGCRVEEAVTLTNNAGDGCIITGKGGRQRPAFWDDVGLIALSEYLTTKDGELDDPLFLRHDWGHVSGAICTNTARSILAEWCRKAGVKVFTPHQFRHRFGVLSLRQMDLALVQDLMGHESPETTRIYTQFSGDELRQAHAAAQY